MQKEFESRVKMNVSFEEYSHIEQVYMNSDLDKDEFCKLWVKMNHMRVEKAISEAKAIAQKRKMRSGLFDIINRDWSNAYENLVTQKFTKSQMLLVENAGIKLYKEKYGVLFGTKFMVEKTLMEVLYEIKKYLNVA